jgi:hypothetical protein
MPVCWLSASSVSLPSASVRCGRDILIWSGTDPGLRDSAVSALLQFLDEVTQAAAQHASRRSAAEQTALSARN